MNDSVSRHPVAWLPIVFSVVALGMVLGHVAMYGNVHEPDEGTPAHVFQLLMLAQVPLVLYFVIKWLPLAPAKTLKVLVLQAISALAAVAAVFWLT